MKSWKTPTEAQVNKALVRMRSPEFAAYFLSRLNNPEWIQPLQVASIFASPPPAIRSEGGGVSFPHWPASKYLRTVAPEAPKAVCDVLLSLKTDNASIIADVIESAKAMPPDVAVQLVPAISQWARSDDLWMAFKDACELTVHLAEGGELNGALTLADALFSPRYVPTEKGNRRRENHWYNDGLAQVIPVLAAALPTEFTVALCRWLRTAIEAKQYTDADSGEDYSTIWRPAVEDHEQNKTHSFTGGLAGMVRLGFEVAMDSGGLLLTQALSMLEGYRFVFFKRLQVYLIGRYAEQDQTLARATLLNRSLFDDYQVRHEYAGLVGKRLPLLSESEQATWYGWIDAGPDMSDFDALVRQSSGSEPTDDDRKRRIAYWKFERLHWARTHLKGNRKAFYQSMLQEYGDPPLSEVVVRSSIRWGDDSPVSVEDWAGQTLLDVATFLRHWAPNESQKRSGANVEGLATTLGDFVAKDPVRYSSDAPALKGLAPIHVRTFLGQMVTAATQGVAIDIPRLLDLCDWVISRPMQDAPKPRSRHPLSDPDWQWSRNEVSRLIEAICVARDGDKPRYLGKGLRERFWSLLEVLCTDDPKSNLVRETSDEDPRAHDYLDLGINSARGRAVEAALEYARWWATQIKEKRGALDCVPGGLNSMPEILKLLASQMEPANRTIEALSVIGSRIGLLFWIDPAWVAKNATALFDLEGILRTPPDGRGWAAWNAFIVWVPAHVAFYRVMKPEFAFAVQQATTIELFQDDSKARPMRYLGQHLMLLYGRGDLKLDEDNGIIRTFVEKTPPDCRRSAIQFVGQSVTREDRLPPEVLSRFQTLWDEYWKGPGMADAKAAPSAFLFGQWFGSRQFPTAWALERLLAFTEVVELPEPDHLVVETLAAIAEQNATASLEILERMINGDKDGWHVHGWIDSARSILTVGLKSTEANRKKAEAIVHLLGRRGFTNLGELLQRAKGVTHPPAAGETARN